MEIIKIKYKGDPGVPLDNVEYDEDEIKEIPELKRRQLKKLFIDRLDVIFITFANVETKLFVEQEMRSEFATLSPKMLRLGSIIKFCCPSDGSESANSKKYDSTSKPAEKK